MRKVRKSLGLSLTLATALVLSGCQSGGLASSPLSSSSAAADSRLSSKTEQYEAKFFGSSGMGACVTGAITGGLLGAITGQIKGKDTETTVKGAAIGAATGCVAAMGANYYLEKQRVGNANKEAQINSAISDVKTLNAGIASDIKNARAVIKEDKATLANLNKQLKNKTIELSAARSQLAKVDANLKQLSNIRSSMQKQYDEFVSVSKQHKDNGASKSKTASLDKEIAQVKKQISEMDNLIADMNAQRTAIKVG